MNVNEQIRKRGAKPAGEKICAGKADKNGDQDQERHSRKKVIIEFPPESLRGSVVKRLSPLARLGTKWFSLGLSIGPAQRAVPHTIYSLLVSDVMRRHRERLLRKLMVTGADMMVISQLRDFHSPPD